MKIMTATIRPCTETENEYRLTESHEAEFGHEWDGNIKAYILNAAEDESATLEAMAQNLRHMDGLIVCAMDARRSQVYNAVFTAEGGQLTRLTPDRAIALSQLAEELQGDPRPKLVVGDGAALCSGFLSEAGIPCRMAPAQLVMQNAVGVALAAEEMAARGETVSARDLVPVYLRLSQAERERLAKGLKITLD